MKRMNGKRKLCLLLAAAILLGSLPSMTASAAYANGYEGGISGDGVGIYAYGVDISAWQGSTVDFEKIAADGYSFVILRAGYAENEDGTFEDNYKRAKSAGLNVGAYLYSYADTTEEALREAAAMKQWLKGKQLEYPVYYDLEDPETHGGLSKETLTDIALTFLDEMAKEGWLVGLYSCKSWLETKMDTAKICKTYECWMAHFVSDGTYQIYDRYDEAFGMWQYSPSGIVDGVAGGVDMNVAFKDYPAICRQFGFNGYTATGETLALSGVSAPTVLTKGEIYPVEGRILSSGGNLTSVTVGFYDQDGEQVTGRSAGPKQLSYELKDLASGVKSVDLPEGIYYYCIYATNSKDSKCLLRQQVVVSGIGARLDDASTPGQWKEGDEFFPKGVITASTAIQSVTVSVVDSGNKTRCSLSAAPAATEFDLSKLEGKMNVSSLQTGEYTYCVDVKTQKGSKRLLSEEFRIWVRSDPVTISSAPLKKEYYPGDEITLDGTLTSQNSNLDGVYLKVTDAFGTELVSAELTPKKQELALSTFNTSIDLKNLPVGAYLCEICALNAAGPVTAGEYRFIVRPDDISLCGLEAPTMLTLGDGFHLRGVVASDVSALEFVSVTVADVNGAVLLSAAAVPMQAAFDLSAFDSQLVFSDLKKGTYTLRISSENMYNYTTLYEAPLTITVNRDTITWSDEYFDPAGLSYGPGSTLGFYGELTSAASNITDLEVSILGGDGHTVMSASTAPNDTVAYLAQFNQMLRLAALPAGGYRLIVTAENASGRYVMLQSDFFVTECLHLNVYSGTVYEANCVSGGAICDSRCLDCGAKVRAGQALEKKDHEYVDGVCKSCRRGVFKQVNAIPEEAGLRSGGRYVLTCIDGETTYALGAGGETVEIAVEQDMLQVSAELLWEPVCQRDGTVLLRNPYGEYLHLDSGGLFVGAGRSNGVFVLTEAAGLFTLSQSGEQGRCLSFSDAAFSAEKTAAELLVYVYQP